MALLLYFTYSFLKTLAIQFFIVNLGVLDIEFFTQLQNFCVLRFLVKVFEYGYISVTINGIAFIFDIQLAIACKKQKIFVNLGVLDLEFFYKMWVF